MPFTTDIPSPRNTAFRARFALFLTAVLPLIAAGSALAGSFTISTASTAAQTLGTGSGQTGIVTDTGSLTVTGATVAVTISGNNATLTNLGTISQTGNGRVIRDNTGVTGLIINNGSATNSTALMLAADADVIQMNKSPASVTLNNYGTMSSLNASVGGSQAVDFSAIGAGANLINNFSTGMMKAIEADAVRPGVNGVVYNAGTIFSSTTTGSSSDGVDAQNNSGVQVANDTTGLIEGARHGITGGALNSSVTFTTTVTNNLGGVIKGDNGSGINLDGFNANESAMITNFGTITGNGVTGDGDGVDVDGLVNIMNKGTIQSLNALNDTSEGISVGGGIIDNFGTIKGLVSNTTNNTAVGRGITLVGNDITTGPLAGTREGIYGDSTVTNETGGLIMGQSDSGIAVGGPATGFKVTINNNAGATIQGGGLSTAALLTGADNDTLNEAGIIDGSSSGLAVNLGAGNNIMSITGGSASILGSIDGGVGGTNTLTIDPGTGNAFSYSGSVMDFSLVDVASGMVTLSGVSTYIGTTEIDGGVLDLDGANRLASGSSLDLNGGTLETADAGGPNGQSFDCLTLAGSSTIDLQGTSLTFSCLGAVGAGKTLTIEDYLSGVSPTYAIRFAGDLTSNAAFLALVGSTTIDGNGVVFQYDGTYTDLVAASPEPSTWAMIALGSLLGPIARRRFAHGKQS